MLPTSGDSFGSYRIGRLLGKGGMGVVHAATHIGLGRDVALKLLAPHLSGDPSYRQRFVREAQALARLDSPHVVRVYDAGEQDGWLFIATELVPDGDLAGLVAAGGLAPERAAHLVAQVARGLQEAHGAGILHRDIKPSNVLLRRLPGGDLRAVLCDFGIASSEDVDVTVTAGVIGTPGYMAPERHEGAPASVASDVYALGCLLWACAAGRPPYEGTASQILLGHLHGEIPQLPPASAAAVALNDVLRRSMAKDPLSRPRTAAELADELDAVAAITDAAITVAAGPAASEPPPGVGVHEAETVQARAATRPAPPPAAPTQLQPRPSSPTIAARPRRGRRAALVLTAAVVLALAATGAILALTSGHGHSTDRATQDPATPARTPASHTAAPSGPATTAPVLARCWDPGERPGDGCRTWPTGALGMRWVFPRSSTSCQWRKSHDAGRSFGEWCSSQVHYSLWSSLSALEAHYGPLRVGAPLPAPAPGLVAWHIQDPTTGHAYKVVVFYDEAHAPWDVTLYADSAAEYRRLLAQVSFRPVGQLRGA